MLAITLQLTVADSGWSPTLEIHYQMHKQESWTWRSFSWWDTGIYQPSLFSIDFLRQVHPQSWLDHPRIGTASLGRLAAWLGFNLYLLKVFKVFKSAWNSLDTFCWHAHCKNMYQSAVPPWFLTSWSFLYWGPWKKLRAKWPRLK